MANLLKKEFDFYLENQDDLVARYDGQVIVLKDCAVIGVYSSELAAYTQASKSHKKGTFMIQRVSAGTKDYTATFNSRVTFPSTRS